MIDRVLAGTSTDEDVANAQALDSEGRKKLVERLLGTLEDTFGDAVLLDNALQDVSNALKQARPVFAAGLPVDQALGFITKMVQDSLDELESAGADDTEEHDKQELVLNMLNSFMDACKSTGNDRGESALETAHYEYRGEVAKLDNLRATAERGMGNAIAFLQRAYPGGSETDAFAKGIDHQTSAARFIGKFGSPSFFAYKHVGIPGEARNGAEDTEDDRPGV